MHFPEKAVAFLFSLLVAGLLQPVYALSGNTGCLEGSGSVKNEQRDVSPFNAIQAEGAFDIRITCGKKQQITVRTDDNLLPHISTTVAQNVLRIETKRSICTESDLSVIIEVPDIEKIESEGANDINITGIDNQLLELSVDGSGDIAAAGKTALFKASLSGATDLEANQLIAQSVVISIEGAGDAEVHAAQKLQASVDGAGSITYSGNPKEVVRKIDGAGDITAE